MHEVKSADKGMLIPRVALTGITDETTISSPAVSLMIYNTATATDVTPGFYYWTGIVLAPVSKTADGTKTKETAETDVTVTGIGTTASPDVGISSGTTNYSVGGFVQGGIVFWVDETEQHGLVCAKEDQSTGVGRDAGSWTYTQVKGNGTDAGEANTTIIIAAKVYFGNDGDMYAARICNQLQITEGGKTYDDGYLPSKYELNQLYENMATIDSTAKENEGSAFVSTTYWRSSAYFDNGRGYRSLPMVAKALAIRTT